MPWRRSPGRTWIWPSASARGSIRLPNCGRPHERKRYSGDQARSRMLPSVRQGKADGPVPGRLNSPSNDQLGRTLAMRPIPSSGPAIPKTSQRSFSKTVQSILRHPLFRCGSQSQQSHHRRRRRPPPAAPWHHRTGGREQPVRPLQPQECGQ